MEHFLIPVDALYDVFLWQGLWLALAAVWLGFMGYWLGQWTGDLADWLTDHVDRRMGHRVSAWLALRRASAASHASARETVASDWPGPRVATPVPPGTVNDAMHRVAPAGGSAQVHRLRAGTMSTGPSASRSKGGIQGVCAQAHSIAADDALSPREGSIVGHGPIEATEGGLNPKGKSPARRGTPTLTCFEGTPPCATCIATGACLSEKAIPF